MYDFQIQPHEKSKLLLTFVRVTKNWQMTHLMTKKSKLLINSDEKTLGPIFFLLIVGVTCFFCH